MSGPDDLRFQLEKQDEPVLAHLQRYHEMVTGKRLSYLSVIRLSLKSHSDYLKQFEPKG